MQSTLIDPQDYDFSELDKNIRLVEEDLSGLGSEQKDPVLLAASYQWITRRGWGLTFLLVIIWPLLSVPAGVFSKNYFAFWVLIAIAWGFGAAIIIIVLPVMESTEDIGRILGGIYGSLTGTKPTDPSEIEEEEEAQEEPSKLVDVDAK
jgi:hypothetical protein